MQMEKSKLKYLHTRLCSVGCNGKVPPDLSTKRGGDVITDIKILKLY